LSDKSNEITAIPALLELLDLAGCIITIMDNNYMLKIIAACLSQYDDASKPACQ